MKQLLLIFIVCISCFSCNKKEKEETVEIISVDLNKVYEKTKFPNTNEMMQTLRLNDHKDFIIGEIDKLLVKNNILYILDRSKSKALFMYGRDGEFLHIINQRGSGPGQFAGIDDFDVEKKTGNIVVLDTNQRKFIYYSPEGTFIREFKFDLFITNFILDDDDTILADKGNFNAAKDPTCLVKIDMNGKVLKDFFTPDPSTKRIPLGSRLPLQYCGGKIYYQPAFSNCIYALDGDKSNLAYQIDFGSSWPSKDFCEKMESQHPLKIRKEMLKNDYVSFLNFMQTEKVLHLDFLKNEKRHSFYYNKQTKKSLLITLDDDNITFPLGTDGDNFVFAKYKEEKPPVIVFYTVNFDLK